jgi:ABC-2 type transport system ATP-binding protein
MLSDLLRMRGNDDRVTSGKTESLKERSVIFPAVWTHGDLTVLETSISTETSSFRMKSGTDRKAPSFTNLKPFGKRKAQDLSGGMKQKLGLICALIHTPQILFLDEPTTGVDPLSRRDFWMILYDLLKEGVTILFSTSYLDEAERAVVSV